MVGGHLIRSLGLDCSEGLRLKGQDSIGGGERILEDSDFAINILSDANEKTDHRYEFKSLGYDTYYSLT